jgi:hypothetical protein
MRSSTELHSPGCSCLKSLTDGYHGLSVVSRSQRQSGINGNRIHVGLPSAALRCATLVSTDKYEQGQRQPSALRRSNRRGFLA